MKPRKTVQLVVRMCPESHKALAAICEQSGLKQSAVIRDLCEAAVAYAAAHDGQLPRAIELADAAAAAGSARCSSGILARLARIEREIGIKA